MARIRSIHPGIWTDEAFVSVSVAARLLFIGILNECDDQGAFEWKPLQLKMRLAPADNIDVAGLLSELSGANLVREYAVSGSAYGAVRHFRHWQRPKKANSVHPMPDESHSYAGAKNLSGEPVTHQWGTSSPPVPHQLPTSGEPVPNRWGTGGEKSPQMEDGGGREGRKKESKPSSTSSPVLARDAGGVIEQLGKKLRGVAYAPGAYQPRGRQEQLDCIEDVPRPKASSLTPEQLSAMRRSNGAA